MIIDCICGKKKFRLADDQMPAEGSKVRCGSCAEVWFYHPNQGNYPTKEETKYKEKSEIQTNPSTTEISPAEPSYEEPTSNTAEEPPVDDPEELLSTIDPDEVAAEAEKETRDSVSNFKIFTDEDDDLPSKEEMDKNLDKFKFERDKNLNFFQKLFKKDRMRDAAEALEKKKADEISEEEQQANQARRTRLLFYLLIVLSIVGSVFMVPLKSDLVLMFPFLEGYINFLIPVFEYIRPFIEVK